MSLNTRTPKQQTIKVRRRKTLKATKTNEEIGRRVGVRNDICQEAVVQQSSAIP